MLAQTMWPPRGGSLAGAHARRSGDTPIRLVVIDEHRLVRDRLAALLEEYAPFEVVATSDGVTAGLIQVRAQKADIALVDAGLCRGDTARSCAQAREMLPDVGVIMMDVTPTGDDLLMMIEIGVKGFVLRDATVDDLVATIRAVADGTTVFPDPLIPTLWSRLNARPTAQGVPRLPPGEVALTVRERQVALLVGEGCSNKEIAQRLCIATHTVKSHLHHILKKLELHTRLQLAASQAGWPRHDRR